MSASRNPEWAGMLTNGVFWGALLILWGIAMIVETVFHIHIPLFRIVCAFVVIAVGIRILRGRSWWPGGGKGDVVTK